MNYKYIFILFVFSVCIAFLSSCTKSDDSDKSELKSGHGDMTTSGELHYTVPEEWIEEKPRSSMRKAQFKIPGKNHSLDAELAIFVFPGSGGAVQANIDRWIGQFKQPDGSSTEEKTKINKLTSNGLPVTLVYLTGTYLGGSMGGPMGGTSKELPGFAMLAAIVETSSDPWFFKAVGPQVTVDDWRPAFELFAKTFKLE